ncbi:MAG: FtsX-like permease family protein [Candidatus Latescibacteria bacterium]|nr:FtsX-like permease family protein [Candidatus Latescibacterota bacterium]
MPSEQAFVREQRTIGKQVILPWSKAVEISLKSLRIRFGRSLITISGIVLAIAFLMSIRTNTAVIQNLKMIDDPEVSLMLQKKGIEVEAGSTAESEEQAKNLWLTALSLLVCFVGIVNAMLMSVTERFREIGTMKCLGALDTFIVKLFLLESSFQGMAGTVIGAVIGFLLAFVLGLYNYGTVVLGHFPIAEVIKAGLLSILIGSILSVVGAIYPAYRAAKMEPVEAMRTEV